jgi:hypothetical protein
MEGHGSSESRRKGARRGESMRTIRPDLIGPAATRDRPRPGISTGRTSGDGGPVGFGWVRLSRRHCFGLSSGGGDRWSEMERWTKGFKAWRLRGWCWAVG